MPSSRSGSHSLTLITVGGKPATSPAVANDGQASGLPSLKASIPYPTVPRLLCRSSRMPLFSVEDGHSGVGHCPLMYGHSAYRPLTSPRSPSRLSFRPVASVRLPPPLSPATMIRAGSMPRRSALATTHLSPDTQSSSPAGNGATSGTDDGDTQLRKSTMTTATPLAAMIFPQPRYMPS